jgi:hypothetical protein
LVSHELHTLEQHGKRTNHERQGREDPVLTAQVEHHRLDSLVIALLDRLNHPR